ncbi:E3 ubiquitin-protein ligase UHRF1 [Octopus bimaculoides]|uniref:YDG domain-containing protein n=1 Tax=Octopus bimaculoides TaxID=37653 RepID=A0A0L8H8G0_OCTBM|nr:E3 ubiquitin-protein ligase UHRF1 [Octopus bimaculoides]|eukprot:XP_014774607.1 PREDICTED: E3 ubiquitin-protein ligase UHRF1-like [Octopus bimaculoides]
MCSEYEKLRLKNLADNRRVLAELGIRHSLEKFQVVHKPIKRKAQWTPKASKRSSVPSTTDEGSISVGAVRRSCRLRGEKPSENNFIELLDEDKPSPAKRIPQFRENTFGSIEGVEVGTWWQSRVECSYAGIHRPTVAGIHGSETEGAYSIALSGGYEDDLDFGECFTYTGAGGRDLRGTKTNPKNLRTAPQSKDQTLTRGNLALSRNCELGRPVRVIRGYKSQSDFAPEEGYRYDGLYTVEKYWYTIGLSGFGVWKFALRRCPNQAPPPWTMKNQDTFSDKANEESDADSGVDLLDSDTASQHSNSSSSSNKDNGLDLVKKDNCDGDSPAEENDSDEDGVGKCNEMTDNDINGEDSSV